MLPVQNSDRGRVARNIARLMWRLNGRRRLPPVSVLAADLGVSRRTVWRYLKAIEEAGWPVPEHGWQREVA